jgi:hypothetical protein
MINVSDINPATLLAALYNNSQVMGMGFLQERAGDMTIEQAQNLLDGKTIETDYNGFKAAGRAPGEPAYFDYLYGRPLKIKIGGPTVNPWGYDRDNGGDGTMQVIVDQIRQAMAPL